MRELMRELLSSNVMFTGIVLVLSAVTVFYGSVYLINATNLGKKLAFLVVGAGLSGWLAINSLLFVMYAPRGPKPANFEGLNNFEIRIIPLSWMIVSTILFFMFLTALGKWEQEQDKDA
jgi:hypothetical protein